MEKESLVSVGEIHKIRTSGGNSISSIWKGSGNKPKPRLESVLSVEPEVISGMWYPFKLFPIHSNYFLFSCLFWSFVEFFLYQIPSVTNLVTLLNLLQKSMTFCFTFQIWYEKNSNKITCYWCGSFLKQYVFREFLQSSFECFATLLKIYPDTLSIFSVFYLSFLFITNFRTRRSRWRTPVVR